MPDPLQPRDRVARGVWQSIPSGREVGWVDHLAARPVSHGPLGEVGPTIRRMLDAGVAREDIARLVRISGYEAAFATLYLMGDPYTDYEDDDVDPGDQISWDLYRVDPETRAPIEPLTILHEGLLAADPEADEMPPPGAAGAGSG